MCDNDRIWGSEESEEVRVIDRIFGQRKREVQIYDRICEG